MKEKNINKLVKNRTKNLQKAFSSKHLIRSLVQECDSLEDVRSRMAYVFEYYLTSMDKKTNYSFNDIIEKREEFTKQQKSMKEPLIEQSYYFQAFNGCYEKTFKKNSLDDISDLEPEIKEAFELLEREVSESAYAKGGDSEGHFCSFITSDAKTLMRYALDYSPERLWYGPLGEIPLIPSKDPIKIGETKEQYMMKMLKNEIKDKSEEEKEEILKAGKIVCEAFGSKRPRIAIIPESSIKDYSADFSGFYSSKMDYKTISQLSKSGNSKWIYTLRSSSDFADLNGIAIYDKIKGDQFTIISIPDAYELAQIFAIERGAYIGDLIDPQTGEIVERAKPEERMPAVIKTGLAERIEAVVDKLKNLRQTENETVEAEKPKRYRDHGDIYLGGTGEMHLCTDKEGNQYLFKPSVRKYTNENEPFRAEAQVLASKLQEIISPQTAVKCEHVEINGRKGTIQPKVDVDEVRTKQLEDYYYNDVPMDEKTTRQLMREYVVDYCLANYDGHFNNFIIDRYGNLRGVDKEQSLKHILSPEAKGDLKMDEFCPNQIYGENPPIYGKIFKDIEEGKIPATVLEEVTDAIKQVGKMPREDYLSLFEGYIETVTTDKNVKNEIREGILERLDSLLEIQKMVEEYNPRQTLTSLSKISKHLKSKVDSLIGPKKEHNKIKENANEK